MELADLERAVSAEVEDQVRTLASAGQRVSLADANLRLAQDTLAGEEALMAVGRTIQKNVLEARNAVAQARVDLSRAHTDFELAQARLLQLQGQLTVAGAP
jgi:outer membrane protein TolC